MIDVKKDYPDRYYARYDLTATQPTAVTGWYDTWDMSSVANVPAASDMIIISEENWNDITFRLSVGKGVQDGKIIDYTAPAYEPTLKEQAGYALATARTYVNNHYTILNEPTPDEWVTYLKALMAISNGTDTNSTSLPSEP